MMRGSCLCGSVEFEVAGPLRPVIACHCTQCRKQSGHFWAATSAPRAALTMAEDRGLRWFSASQVARRGFCAGCGAFLFWDPAEGEAISFAAGCLDRPTGLSIAESWHEEDAGDYYLGPPGTAETLHAACLCGTNRFTLPGPMGEVTACHCTQCRKTSGHFAASFDAEEASLVWQSRDVTEHRGPDGGVRGFCGTCGSSLYFRKGRDFAVEAGVVENPTGGRLARHMFIADKGDYYTLDDGLPQSATT